MRMMGCFGWLGRRRVLSAAAEVEMLGGNVAPTMLYCSEKPEERGCNIFKGRTQNERQDFETEIKWEEKRKEGGKQRKNGK